MTDESQRPIVIKRKKASGHGHHGGAWKIAYADFVTAMMAFFLLMWLLGSTTKGQLQGIAEYFQTPLAVAFGSGESSSASSNPINGGGADLTRSDQQVKRGALPDQRRLVSVKAAQDLLMRQEMEKLKALKQRVEDVIDANALLRQYRNQLLIDITSEGLRIQIVDEQNRPMFDLGSAQLKPYAREILLALSKPFNEVENKLSLTGHTDAKPFPAGEHGYSNWELSVDRANASRRVLVAGGIADGKIKRVVGMASAVLFDGKNPYNPINRRIAIIVLNKQADEALNRVSGALAVGDEGVSKEALDAEAH